MIKEKNGKKLLLGPRDRGLAFTTIIKNLHTISVDETIQLDGMRITGIKATHGPLIFKLGPFTKTLQPGPKERVGYGAIGFKINTDEKDIVNLGDTLLHETAWKKIENPDVLMIPIGGKIPHNTMDEREALTAVEIMKPKMVIPCHYNCSSFFHKRYNIADDKLLKIEVEKMGIRFVILDKGESTHI
jgi:L-ascorbate metabolism protein UlaG (beta-lactamase superfamily)